MSNHDFSTTAGMQDFNERRSYDFAQVDVFAERALEGNGLAIFTDARGLSTAEMEAIARETNQSETTFILPRSADIERSRGVLVRIFLTTGEIPFAGHPTLGTAAWLYWNNPALGGSEQITLELEAGLIPVRFKAAKPGETGIFGTMRQNDPVFGDSYSSPEHRGTIAAALGLSPEDLDQLPPQVISTGMAFCIVLLRSLAAAARMQIVPRIAREYLDRIGAKYFYCIARCEGGATSDWHARMQFDSGEDPATGSAAGCAISYLVAHGVVSSGSPVVLEQGIEMRRASRMHVRASLQNDVVCEVFVGGRTVPVASGRLFLS